MQDACMTVDPLRYVTCQGGDGVPVVLVHGLMGRGTTWSRQIPWLKRLGTVYTYDAPWHRGRDVLDPHPISTERFVEDLADAVADTACARGADRSLDGRSAFLVPGRRPARVGGRAWWSRTWRPTSAAAPPGPGSRGCMRCRRSSPPSRRCIDEFGPSPAGTSGGVRPDTNGLAVARPSRTLGPDRRRVGHPGLLAAVAVGPGAGAVDRGGQLGHPARADAADARDGFGNNISARSRGGSPGARRRAAGSTAMRWRAF